MNAREGDQDPQQRILQLVEQWKRPPKNPPRWHHYVPKFYLRGFADSKGCIARVSRDTGDVDLIPTKQAAAELDFNRIELPSGEASYEIENMLSWVENSAAPALRRITKGIFPPSEKDRDALTGFLGLQFTRGRKSRDQHQLIEEWKLRFPARENFGDPERARHSMREATGSEPSDDEVAEMVRLATEPDAYEIVTPDTNSIKIMLDVATEAMLYLFDITWSCLRSARPLLVTSDNPLNTWSKPEKVRSFWGQGLVTSDEVRFAVDPKTMLVLTPEGDPAHATNTDEWAWEMNQNTIFTAYRWVFAPPDHPDLDRVAERAKEAPTGGMQVDAFGETTILRRESPKEDPERQRRT